MNREQCHSMWNSSRTGKARRAGRVEEKHRPGACENRCGRLLLLNARSVDHLLPARNFTRQIFAETLRRRDQYLETLRRKTILDGFLPGQS